MTVNGNRLFWVLGLLVGLSAVPTHAADADAISVQIIRVPEGGIHPEVQTDGRGRLHLIYVKGDPSFGDIFYVRSDDGGGSFTPPLRVNSQPGSAVVVGTIRGPHIAVGKNDRVHVAWMGSGRAKPKACGKALPMLYARMNDQGDGFETQRNVIQKWPGLDGGGSIAADAEGTVYVAWHAPESGGTEEDRTVWITRSLDDGKTFDAETTVLPMRTGACAGCGLGMVAGSDRRVFILYRSAEATLHRDMYLLASKNRGETFTVLNTDTWTVGQCVMSTSMFALSDAGLLAAWETQKRIHVVRVHSGEAEAVHPLEVPNDGWEQKYPAIAINQRGEIIVVWAEGTGWNVGGSVAWQVFDKDGVRISGQSGRTEGLPVWSTPAAFARPDNTFGIVF